MTGNLISHFNLQNQPPGKDDIESRPMRGAFLPSFVAGQKKVGTAVPKHLRYIKQ